MATVRLANLTKRLDYLQSALGSKTFIMGEQFTAADVVVGSTITPPGFSLPDFSASSTIHSAGRRLRATGRGSRRDGRGSW